MSFSDRTGPVLDAIGAALTSEAALLVYSWTGVLLIASISVSIGVQRFLSADQNLHVELHKILKKPGPVPTRAETIQARRDARNEVLKSFARQLGVTAFFVMGIPLAGLAVVTIASDWFFAGQPLFVDRLTGDPVGQPSNIQLGLFILDQLLKGALLDFMEVFRVQFSAIENSTTNWPYSGLVLGFRVLLDVYALAMIAKLLRAFRRMFAPLTKTTA